MTEVYREDYFLYEDEAPEEKRRYLVVVIYDIVDNRRRSRMVKYLNGFGVRVQRSAFECTLDMEKYKKLVAGISKYVAEEDLLRIYRLAGNADVKIWGDVGSTQYEDVVIV